MSIETGQPGEFFYVLQEPLNLLFVDDDPILREFAVVHLSSEQATVETAPDGASALARLETHIPDILLLDLEMPHMDGFEVLQRLRADPRLERLPVIVVTGRDDVAAVDRAFELGADFFDVKPIGWRLLSYKIRFVHRASQAEREARASAQSLSNLALESSRFLQLALTNAPGLKGSAGGYAAALEAAVNGAAAA
jgi:DNA-binding response OmpR family regulator